ncbi:MAG: hypothetical protein Q9157_004233 [Trypethelium eluteriae]
MFIISSIPLVLLLCQPLVALVARAPLPPQFTVIPVGQETSNFANVHRDGGGGGNINGKNILLFCDTLTPTGFVANSATYSNSEAPEDQIDFGENDNPTLAIPFTPTEEAFTNAAFPINQTRTVLWPGSSITYLGGSKGMFFANVAQYNVEGTGAGNQYNTLVTVTANEAAPSFVRTLEQAFYANGPLWGSFGGVYSELEGILLFANTDAGMKVAKVPPLLYADLSQYTYWTGSEWSSMAPNLNDTASAFIPGLNPTSGDIFWSNYYRTWIFVYMALTNVFYYRYSLNGGINSIIGPWSDEFELYDTSIQTWTNGETYDYAGHAYSGYDPTGRSIMLSWSHGLNDEYMARVQFK